MKNCLKETFDFIYVICCFFNMKHRFDSNEHFKQNTRQNLILFCVLRCMFEKNEYRVNDENCVFTSIRVTHAWMS